MMEFEEEHEEEEEEEEEESEMAITPTFKKQHHPTAAVRYRECLKNHAIGIGGHAVDGCGEFLPAGAEGSIDAFRCAACSCHRNFHRKEYNNSIVPPQLAMYAPRPHHHQHPHQQHPHQVYQIYPYSRNNTGGYLHVSGGQRPLALPSPTSGGPHNNHHQEESGGGGDQGMGGGGGNGNVTTRVGGGGTMMDISGGSTMLSGGSNTTSSGKKRFRTKFTPEQKDKMLDLAERLGWRIQKQDEELVHQFCNETGIKRHVLKVWMHNNKLTLDYSSEARPGFVCARPR